MKELTDERRTTLAVLLCIIVVMFYSEMFLSPTTTPQIPLAQNPQTTSTPSSSSQQLIAKAPSPWTTTQPQADAAAPRPSIDEMMHAPGVEIISPLQQVSISSLGGRIRSLKLVHYKESLNSQNPLEVITSSPGMTFPLGLLVGEVSDELSNYTMSVNGATLVNGAYVINEQGSATVVMTSQLADGTHVTKEIVVQGNSYQLKVAGKVTGTAPQESRFLSIEWARYSSPRSKSQFDLENFTVFADGKISIVTPDSLKGRAQTIASPRWIGVGDRYFLSALIGGETTTTGGLAVLPVSDGHNDLLSRVSGSPSLVEAQVFVGPKDLDVLLKEGHDLTRSVDLGWFSFLAHPFLSLLRFFESIFHNWGLAIIALTLIIKIIFLPLNRASLQSMAKMQEIQPEVKALRERIKDATELNQAIMKLYKERNINPLGGCFPVFLQIPVFFGLYNALVHAIELRHAPFALWIHDLSAPEALPILGFGIPVMVLLFGASMFVQQLVTPAGNIDPAQRKIMLAMPVMFTFFFLGFPSGLTLYYLVNNSISIVQQVALRNKRGISPLAVTLGACSLIFMLGFALTRV